MKIVVFHVIENINYYSELLNVNPDGHDFVFDKKLIKNAFIILILYVIHGRKVEVMTHRRVSATSK